MTIKFFLKDIYLSFKSSFIYRNATLLNLTKQLLSIYIMFTIWAPVFAQNKTINGMTANEMLMYFFLSSILSTAYPNNLFVLYGNLIKNGQICTLLVKPYNYEIELLSRTIGKSIYNIFIITLPLFLIGVIMKLFHFVPPISIGKFCIIFFINFMFIFFMELILGILIIIFNNMWGLKKFKGVMFSFLSGEFLPINFYPKVLREILRYTPFTNLYLTPIMLLMNKNIDYNASIIIGVIYLFIEIVIYNLLKKKIFEKISIVGG